MMTGYVQEKVDSYQNFSLIEHIRINTMRVGSGPQSPSGQQVCHVITGCQLCGGFNYHKC